MKLIYNPYFGSRPYIDLDKRSGIFFADKAVSSPALLDELELFTGNKGKTVSDTERLVCYVVAMRKALSEGARLFFKESFENDELGTAKILLSWRDALVMALWDSEKTDGSGEKLKALAAIEKHFDTIGYADRWTRMLSYVDESEISLDLSIECVVSLQSLQPCIRRVLEILKDKGISVVERAESLASAQEGTDLHKIQEVLLGKDNSGTHIPLKGDGSFRYIHFKTPYNAYRWFAASSANFSKKGLLLVCRKPSLLNSFNRALGLPLLGAAVDSYPLSYQFFLLALSLFKKDVDVDNLLSYLRVPSCPVGNVFIQEEKKDGSVYYLALDKKLESSLISDGGLEKWPGYIESAVYDKAGNLISEKEKQEALSFLYMWNKVFIEDGKEKVKKTDLKEFLNHLCRWAVTNASVHSEDLGYESVAKCCRLMGMLLENASDDVFCSQINKWVSGLFSPIHISVNNAEVGSIESVADVRDIFDSPKHLFWLGSSSDARSYPYSFLSAEERKEVGVISAEAYSRYDYLSTVYALGAVSDRLTIVTIGWENGTPTVEHPVCVSLEAKFDFIVENGESLPLSPEVLKEEKRWEDDKAKTVYTLNKNLFSALKDPSNRRKESYSSLDMLIQHPFDYVIEKVLGFHQYGEDQLQDMALVQGNMAHRYVELLVKEGNRDLTEISRIHANHFDEFAEQAAKQVAAALLLEKNKLLWNKNKGILRKSVSELLCFIEENKFSIEGTEMEFNVVLPDIGKFYAKMDLVLKNAEDSYVIVDMKWSESKTYVNKMEARDIMQLVLYKAALEADNKKVYGYGYWLFPKYKFITELVPFQGDMVDNYRTLPEEQVGLNDVFLQVRNSYKFRYNQLLNGIVEEGELSPLTNLDYYKNQDILDLYPLRADYNDKTIKERPYGSINITLKGGLE